MPILKNAAAYGVHEPEDLNFLQSVFAEACAKAGRGDPEEIARKLLVMFQGGVRDRELLLTTITRAYRPARRGRPKQMQ
jgi:hypothetical protein